MFKFNMTSNLKKGLLIGAAGVAVFAGGFGSGMTAEKVSNTTSRQDRFESRSQMYEEPGTEFFGSDSESDEFGMEEYAGRGRRGGFYGEFSEEFGADEGTEGSLEEYGDIFEGDEFFSDRKKSSSSGESVESGATDDSSSSEKSGSTSGSTSEKSTESSV